MGSQKKGEPSRPATDPAPELESLFQMVDDGVSVAGETATAAESAPEAKPSVGASAAGAAAGSSAATPSSPQVAEDPSDDAPTDYYHAVKPKPKGAPLAELTDPPEEALAEPDAAPRQQRHRLARALVGLALLAAAVSLLHANGQLSLEPQTTGASAPPDEGSDAKEEPRANNAPEPDGRRATRQASRDRSADSAGEETDLAPSIRPPGAVVRVKFERLGDAIVVPARLRGPSGELTTKMVFDTGATFSTLTAQALHRIGVPIGSATSETETAAGVLRRPISVVDSIAVGGARVSGGLTVGVCETCTARGTTGLLGLNFSRRFIVTLDHEGGELKLAPKGVADSQLFDIRPFVSFDGGRTDREGDQLLIRFTLKNASPRALRDVVVAAHTQDTGHSPQAQLAYVPAGAHTDVAIDATVLRQRRVFTLELSQARW